MNIPKTDDGVTSRVIAAIRLRATELADTDGRQGNIAPAGEAEQDGVEAHERHAGAGGQSQDEGCEQAQGDGQDHGVEAAEPVHYCQHLNLNLSVFKICFLSFTEFLFNLCEPFN